MVAKVLKFHDLTKETLFFLERRLFLNNWWNRYFLFISLFSLIYHQPTPTVKESSNPKEKSFPKLKWLKFNPLLKANIENLPHKKKKLLYLSFHVRKEDFYEKGKFFFLKKSKSRMTSPILFYCYKSKEETQRRLLLSCKGFWKWSLILLLSTTYSTKVK